MNIIMCANNGYSRIYISIYIIKTITSFSVRIGGLFVYEGYITTSYVTIVDVILKLGERHKQTTIDIKRHEWRKKRGVENTYIFR